MESFSVFISKIESDSGGAQDFKSSLIEVLCIDDNEADEILKNIPGVIEDNLSKGAAEALADIISSIGGVVEVKDSLEEIQEEITRPPSDMVQVSIETETEETKVETIEEVSNAFSDFNMFDLSLEDEDQPSLESAPVITENSVPHEEAPQKATLAHMLEDDEDSLLDMTLMLEQSKEKETAQTSLSSSGNPKESEPKSAKEVSEDSFDTSSLGLVLEEEVSPVLKIPETPPPKAPEKPVQKSPDTPSPEIEKKTHHEETQEFREDAQIIIKEVMVPAKKQSSQYTLPAIGALVIILAMYILMPDTTTPKQNETINPEIMKQLLKAQKAPLKKDVVEKVVVEKKTFESKISNKAWEMKSRVESLKGGIQSLEVQFSNKNVSLPTPEEYITKEFIPQIVTIGLTYRATPSENSLPKEVSVPARIYTKTGDVRKRFTIPLMVSLNEEGRLMSILSGKEVDELPPGTFIIENYDKENDTISPKIYFMIPLKEVAAKETRTDPPVEK
jgi:hypothetical protein